MSQHSSAGTNGSTASVSNPGEDARSPGPGVDASLTELRRLPELDVVDHVAVFETIHTSLRDQLGRTQTGCDRPPL